MVKKLVLCDCAGSQIIDAEAISQGSDLVCSKVYTSLCTDQINDAAKEICEGGALLACQQERLTFEELANELEAEVAGFVDLRDRAGWGTGNPAPKMAALAAEAALPLQIGKSVDVISEGTCLILGGAPALEAAHQLSDILAVTVLLSDPQDLPVERKFDCIIGTLKNASGALGGFHVKIDNFQQMIPSGRGAFQLSPPQNGAASDCDIILDLTGQTPLFPAHEKREGYVKADPSHAPSTAKAILEASQLIGTFEKPLYVHLEPTLCAHSRAEKPACSNCLNVCPTGAITSAGEHVAIDPMICAGCGSCSAVCPSGAIRYDAPPTDTLFQRLNTLASHYRKSGGEAPRLLVHEPNHGLEMISLAARFGTGLPADVIPFEVEALASFGHAEMMGALGVGFQHIDILLAPKSDTEVIDNQAQLARAMSRDDAITLLEMNDPEALSEALSNSQSASGDIPTETDPVLAIGTRRQITRLTAKALNPEQDLIALPDNAPYGAVVVDTEACTLCLSCVSLCPSGALGDNPDMPQLRFQEDACLQCGLCTNICPEKAITLKPQLDLTDAALSQKVMHEEEPFACIECGAFFGVKSTVEKITEKLAGNHSMFATSNAAKMIQMCDNCRIQAQYHSQNNPFQGGERPAVRTTEDYFSKRKDH